MTEPTDMSNDDHADARATSTREPRPVPIAAAFIAGAIAGVVGGLIGATGAAANDAAPSILHVLWPLPAAIGVVVTASIAIGIVQRRRSAIVVGASGGIGACVASLIAIVLARVFGHGGPIALAGGVLGAGSTGLWAAPLMTLAYARFRAARRLRAVEAAHGVPRVARSRWAWAIAAGAFAGVATGAAATAVYPIAAVIGCIAVLFWWLYVFAAIAALVGAAVIAFAVPPRRRPIGAVVTSTVIASVLAPEVSIRTTMMLVQALPHGGDGAAEGLFVALLASMLAGPVGFCFGALAVVDELV